MHPRLLFRYCIKNVFEMRRVDGVWRHEPTGHEAHKHPIPGKQAPADTDAHPFAHLPSVGMYVRKVLATQGTGPQVLRRVLI